MIVKLEIKGIEFDTARGLGYEVTVEATAKGKTQESRQCEQKLSKALSLAADMAVSHLRHEFTDAEWFRWEE